MAESEVKGLIDDVKSIGERANQLLATIQNKAINQANLTSAEISQIKRLVEQSEVLMSEASQRARTARDQQIKELEEHIKNINLSLTTPSLSASTVSELKSLRRRRRAKLTRLQARAALDFGGVLTPEDITDISEILKKARHATQRKRKAADFIDSLIKIADLSIDIVGKAGKLV